MQHDKTIKRPPLRHFELLGITLILRIRVIPCLEGLSSRALAKYMIGRWGIYLK
jgi:hypothetical protein